MPSVCPYCRSLNTVLVAQGNVDELNEDTADFIGCYDCNTMTRISDR